MHIKLKKIIKAGYICMLMHIYAYICMILPQCCAVYACTTHSLDFCFAFSFLHQVCTHINCNVSSDVVQLLTASFSFIAEEGLNWINKLFINSHGLSLYPTIIHIIQGSEPSSPLQTYKRKASTPLTHMHTCEHLFTLKPHPPKTHIIHATVSMVIAYTP